MMSRLHPEVELRELDREDASGTSSARAVEMLGYAPTRSWRDYLTEDGVLRPEARERLEKGDDGRPARASRGLKRRRVLRAVAAQRAAGEGFDIDGDEHGFHGGPMSPSIQMIVLTMR